MDESLRDMERHGDRRLLVRYRQGKVSSWQLMIAARLGNAEAKEIVGLADAPPIDTELALWLVVDAHEDWRRFARLLAGDMAAKVVDLTGDPQCQVVVDGLLERIPPVDFFSRFVGILPPQEVLDWSEYRIQRTSRLVCAQAEKSRSKPIPSLRATLKALGVCFRVMGWRLDITQDLVFRVLEDR